MAPRPGPVADRQLDVAEAVEVVGVGDVTVFVAFVVFDRVPSRGPRAAHAGMAGQVDQRIAAHAVLQM